MDETLLEVINCVLHGNRAEIETWVKRAIEAGLAPEKILNEGLIAAMSEVGSRFERQEFYVPEMLVAARAMQSGLAILKPLLALGSDGVAGKVVIGTVRGDLHDIGKNLVGMMLEGAGHVVVDLGTDVPPEKFAIAAQEHSPKVVGLSALLTTTMRNMKVTLEALEDVGVRGRVKVVIGGAPVTQAFADKVGADGYAPDASRAVALVRSLL
jgi:5-methyltetrahydrofolate--homocysteine methyltransferase